MPKHKITIQVKTCLKPKPAGGAGPLAIDWYVPIKCSADYIALVHYQDKLIWLMTLGDLKKYHKKSWFQKNKSNYHPGMYIEKNNRAKKTQDISRFDNLKFEKVIKKFI